MKTSESYQVHLIPTEKESKIYYNEPSECLYFNNQCTGIKKANVYQHIYLTSSTEEIGMSDWYIDDVNAVRKSVTNDKEYWSERQEYGLIVASTDKSITPNQWIPQSIVEMIVEYYNIHGEVMEELELIHVLSSVISMGNKGLNHHNKAIIATNPNGSVILAEKKEETWNDIFKKANKYSEDNADCTSLESYLEEHYNSPTKKANR